MGEIINGGCSAAGSSQENKIVIPVFQSDSDSGDEPEKEVPLKKKRQCYSWIFVKTFNSTNDAKEALNEENTWSIDYSNESEEGKKTYYRCNKVKKRGSQCSAKRYLLFDSTSESVVLYRTDSDHDHASKESSMYGLSEAVKFEINKLFDLHMKPKAIMTALTKVEGIQIPKISQVRNYLSDRRRAKYENHTISLRELEQWIIVHSVLPDDLHQAFVIAYEVSEDNATFRFVLSSKYLLKLALNAEVIHADATYKLIWQGYPVLIVGTTDKRRIFHALCLTVATTEQKEDFKLVFGGLKDKIQSLFSSTFMPRILVADASKSIQNAFTEVFEDTTVRMCWAHARRKIQSRIESEVSKSVQKNVLADIDTLHSITCPDAFNTASDFFLQKYQDQDKFIAYFKEQWLLQNRNWYLGAALDSPSTNNALESFNKVIKDSNTLRERFQLSRFLVVATDMVNEWSTKYIKNPKDNSFSKTPLISLKEWTSSYHWAKLPKEVVVLRNNESYTYYQVPGGEANVYKAFEKQPEAFDEFNEQYFNKWEVSLPVNKEDWRLGKCTCPMFFKMYICKHIIGLSIRLKYTTPPVEAKDIPLGEKRKRGRPSKAKPALIIQ